MRRGSHPRRTAMTMNVYPLRRHGGAPYANRHGSGRLDVGRFNQAARSFFEHWRPPSTSRGGMPVPAILVRFDFSANGYLVAHYADPLTRRVSIWGLDVQNFLSGRMVARQLKG